MLVLSILAFVCHALSLCARTCASLDFYNRDGQHLEHKQHTMVCGYVYGAIAQGDHGLLALRQDNPSGIPTLSLVLYNLHQRTDNILRSCLPRYATPGQEEFHSFLVPCGMLYGVAVGPTDREWELRTVSSSSLNITVRHVAAIWDKVSCDLFPNLRISDSGRPHSTLTTLNVTICGNSPQQTHFSASSKVNVAWLSRMFDVSKENFLLSYETAVPEYANYYNLEIKLCTACSEVCAPGEAFSPLMYRGTEYVYTWYITGLVLTAPAVHLHKFKCTNTPAIDAKLRLTVYDAPLSVLDPAVLEIDPSRVMQSLVCSESILKESYKSSIGDMALIATAPYYYKMELSASVWLAVIPCNDTTCQIVTYNLSWGSPKQKEFRILSQGTSQQRAIFLPRSRQESSFITFDELEVHFEGFTHTPCAMGGLFLYQLQPLDLIGQVCSAWTAQIWSGELKQEDGTTRLHLGHRPVMFVIKTYTGFTEGTIKGRVMLGNCLGVINPGVSGKPLASPHYNISSMDMHISRKLVATSVLHKAGCIIFQYFQTDVPGCLQRSVFSQRIWHRSDKNLQAELQFGMTSNMSAYPANLAVTHRDNIDMVCNYGLRIKVKGLSANCTHHNSINGTGHMLLNRRPGSSKSIVFFDTFCLAIGVKMFLRTYFANIQTEFCWTSQKLRKCEIITNQSVVATILMPPVPCLTLPLKENIFGFKRPFPFFTFIRPAFTNNLCCVLFLSILANPLSNVFLTQITVDEKYLVPPDDFIHGNRLLWKYPGPLRPSKSMGINGSMYALKRVSVPLNSLHEDVLLRVFVGSFENLRASLRSMIFLELRYNFTLYSVAHPTMKMLNNYICADAINSCYSFAVFPETTWNSAIRYCSALNMSLLTTQSDFEWNFISHLFAHHPDILKLGAGMQLSYMGLLYNWVSVSSSRHFNCFSSH